MKRNYFTAILLSAFAATAVISCDKTDEIATGTPSVTSSGTISGQIDSLLSGTIDSIKVLGYHFVDNGSDLTLELGKCKINGDKYTMNLVTPTPDMLNKPNFRENSIDSNYYSVAKYTSTLQVSDYTFLMIGIADFKSFKEGIYNGNLVKCNNVSESTTGYKESYFLYSNKNCSIKGTEIFSYKSTNSSYHHTEYSESRNDVTLKSGWNEIVMIVEKSVKTDSSSYVIETYSSTIPTDLKWKWTKYNSSYGVQKNRVQAKLPNHHSNFLRNLLK